MMRNEILFDFENKCIKIKLKTLQDLIFYHTLKIFTECENHNHIFNN